MKIELYVLGISEEMNNYASSDVYTSTDARKQAVRDRLEVEFSFWDDQKLAQKELNELMEKFDDSGDDWLVEDFDLMFHFSETEIDVPSLIPQGFVLVSEQDMRQISDECETAKKREWNADGYGVLKSIELIQGLVPIKYQSDYEPVAPFYWVSEDYEFVDEHKAIDDSDMYDDDFDIVEDELVSQLLVDDDDTNFSWIIIDSTGTKIASYQMLGGIVCKTDIKGEKTQVCDYDDLP